ncbi:sugar transferase [Vibrio gazogenes]|uniref:Sugar transferase involved in LPS biosynthesis (Colanic, teichoic acid) n=1 Tax=Vibrio gazogenes DSM 21264 = NBRC 103151 TaxID=1123492 RepID=A0A1M5D0B0_VIBGA|nr:sugar transferase [Vibrio gazogenes]USP13908.1 sugar transferase [Vibrio gazogenes]SHF60436.1 Sugar transferase involved in LPS biosynthesis (colanic, teichoic acid) [Vibrio gazogenes DSM 21264] [Vibrio gazogenes DSM 21264 = NBRC 103151]SJN56632.1 putative sugar transferase EpsL [Vibrio gazogenes]
MIRLLDFIFALLGLAILWPVMLCVCIVGYFDTKSPIFTQTRVGRYQKPFTLIKFRTMPPDTQSVATHLVGSASVTKLGSFLRKTKIDELPQLINVLKGEMSLVGPRPCLFNQTQLIEARETRGVFNVLPGITGLAQVNEIDMSTPELLAEMDQNMIQTMNIRHYFLYIIQTALGKGSGDRV